MLRGGMLAAAALVSVVALAVSMMPGDTGGGSGGENVAQGNPADSTPVAGPGSVLPSADPATSAAPSSSRPAASASGTPSATGGDDAEKPDPEPQGTSSATAGAGAGGSEEAAACEVTYDLVNQWPDGFQATVTVTTAVTLDGWRVDWSFRDGQKVDQMWDASLAQNGSRVTATAADYNRSVSANGTLTFGFLASWQNKNSAPYAFTLNGQTCTSS